MVSKFTSLNRNPYALEQPQAYRFSILSQWMLTTIFAMVLSSFSFQTSLVAQCGINTFPPGSTAVSVDLITDANGEVTLDQTALIGVANPTGSGCGIFFYDFPAQATPLGNSITLNCDTVSTIVYFVVADDDGIPGGNESSAVTLTVNLIDTMPPSIDCPADISVNNKLDSCFARVTPDMPTIVENCAYLLSWSLSGSTSGAGTGPIMDYPFNVGVTTVTYTINDGVNATDMCTFNVTVWDVQAPELEAPLDATVSADGFCVYTLNPTLTYDRLNFIDPGEYADNCPGTDTLEYSIDGGVNWTVFGTSTNGIISLTGNTTNIGLGTTNVLLRVRDTSGNSVIDAYNVTVVDNTNPTATCPSNATVDNDLDECFATNISGIGVSISDNCPGVISTTYTLSGATTLPATNGTNAGVETFNVGVTTVTYTVTDNVGNMNSCSFTVTVQDTLAPTITPPAAQLLSFNSTCSDGTVPDYRHLASTDDNCDVTIAQMPSPGTMLSTLTGITPAPTEMFKVYLTVTDQGGLTDLDSFDVTIVAGTPTAITPTIPGAMLPADTSVCGELVVDAPTAIGYDLACMEETIYGVPTIGTLVPGSSPPQYTMPVNATTYMVTWNYSGTTGSGSQSQSFTVSSDVTVPVLSVASTFSVFLDANGDATLLPGDVFIDATDECGVILGSLLINGAPSLDLDCSDVGTQVVTSSIFDVNGNVGFANTTITVFDLVSPDVNWIAPSSFALLSRTSSDLFFECDSLPDTTGMNVYAVDACGATTLNFFETSTQDVDPDNFNHYNYSGTFNWAFFDPNGNSSTRSAIYFVEDGTSPEFDSSRITLNISQGVDPGMCTASISLDIDATQLSDNCAAFANLTITNNSPFGPGNASASGNYPVGTTVVTFFATDPSGNSTFITVFVTVADMDPPVAACNGISTVGLPPSGTLIIPPTLIDNGSFDGCGPLDSMWVIPNTFDCDDADGITAHPVTLFVRDQSGNVASCNTAIIIQDNQAPVAQCQDITVELGASGSVTITPGDIDNGSFDNCTDPGDLDLSLSQTTFTDANVGANSVTLYVEDINGNVDSCSATVTVTIEETCFDIVSEMTNIQTGTALTNIMVPVVVQNFTNVQGFQFQVTLGDNTVGEIVGVTSLLPGAGLVTNIISTDLVNVLWTNLTIPPTPVTVADGDTVLMVEVSLIGDENDQTPINLTGDAMSFPQQVRREYNGNPVDQVPCLSGGTLLINSPAMLTVAGNVRTPGGANIAQAIVQLDDQTIMTTYGRDTTGLDGNFSFFPVNEGRDFKITVEKDINWLNNGSSVSAFDLALIQSHIVGIDSLTNPYAKIAADVTGDGLITGFDLVEIHTLLASLGTITPTGTQSWRFIDASIVIPDTVRLIVPGFDNCITIIDLRVDSLTNDYIGVKMADVELNPDPSQLQGGATADTRNARDFFFNLEDRAVKAGETIEINFTSKDFDQLQAYQALLNFDTDALSFIQAIPGDLPGLSKANFGDLNAKDGKLVLLWYLTQAISMADDETLFTLQFRAERDVSKLSQLLSINTTELLPEAFEATGEALNINLNWTPAFVEPVAYTFELGQNKPNPFAQQTVINFTLPVASEVSIQFQDVSGRVLKQVTGNYGKGEHTISVDRNELPTTGVVYYRLDTPEFTAIKKMIVLE